MSYDIDPEKRQGLLETAACEGEQVISGLTLRPLRMGSVSFYVRLLAFLKTSPSSDELTSYCALAFVHSLPSERLSSVFGRPELIVPELYRFMQETSMSQYRKLVEWGDTQYAQWEASKTIEDGIAPSSVSDPKA